MKRPPEDRLLKMLMEGGQARDRAILEIWGQMDNTCRKMVRRMRGTLEDMEDIRQEATEILCDTVRRGIFRGTTDGQLIAFYKTTFFNISNKGMNNRSKMPFTEMEANDTSLDKSIEDILIESENRKTQYGNLRACMESLGERCARIIKWRYFDETPKTWEEIATILGLGSTQTAQNTGGRCMRQLRTCMGA